MLAIFHKVRYNVRKNHCTVLYFLSKGEIQLELGRITPELLDDEQKELADIVGWEAYQKLLFYYAGCRIYIRKPERLAKPDRDAEIYRKFNGNNYRELAREFQLSESAVRKILNSYRK